MYAEPDQHAHEILSILEYALILFRDDHITQAVDLVDSVKPKIKHLPVELQATVQEVFQTKNMRELDSLGNCVISFFNFLNDSSQWKNTWRQNEIAISTSINKTTGVHYFKTAGELHGVDIVSVLGALMENDLFGAWMPCCGSSREVPSSNSETGPLASEEEEIPSSTRRVIQSVFEIMMFKREALFFGYGLRFSTLRPVVYNLANLTSLCHDVCLCSVGDVLSNGDVFVFIKSLPEAELVTSSSIPRVKLEGGFLFGHGATPTSPIRAEIAFSLDPLLDFLPHWMYVCRCTARMLTRPDCRCIHSFPLPMLCSTVPCCYHVA